LLIAVLQGPVFPKNVCLNKDGDAQGARATACASNV